MLAGGLGEGVDNHHNSDAEEREARIKEREARMESDNGSLAAVSPENQNTRRNKNGRGSDKQEGGAGRNRGNQGMRRVKTLRIT